MLGLNPERYNLLREIRAGAKLDSSLLSKKRRVTSKTVHKGKLEKVLKCKANLLTKIELQTS